MQVRSSDSLEDTNVRFSGASNALLLTQMTYAPPPNAGGAESNPTLGGYFVAFPAPISGKRLKSGHQLTREEAMERVTDDKLGKSPTYTTDFERFGIAVPREYHAIAAPHAAALCLSVTNNPRDKTVYMYTVSNFIQSSASMIQIYTVFVSNILVDEKNNLVAEV